MKIRAIDSDGWKFGKGGNDYLTETSAVAQLIECRCKEFLGNCFFALNAGIDWFNLNGGKSIDDINLAVSSTILNTENVTSLKQLSLALSPARNLTITYEAATVYGDIDEEIEFDIGGL